MTLENLVDFINQEKKVDLRSKGSAGRKKFYIRAYFLIAYKYFIDISHREIAKEISRDHATSIYHKDKMIDLISIYKADRDEFHDIEIRFLQKYPALNKIAKIYEDNCNYSTIDMVRKLAKKELIIEKLKRDYSRAIYNNKIERRKVLNRDKKIALLKSKKAYISQLTRSLQAARKTIKQTVETSHRLRSDCYYWKNKCMKIESIEVTLEKAG